MKTLAFVSVLLCSASAMAATAYFTGRSEYVTTVTYKQALSCEYDYLGQKFWRTFRASHCPTSVDVE